MSIDTDCRTQVPEVEAKSLALWFSWVQDRDEEISALAVVIEDALAHLCNHGKNAPDGAPLHAWHLSRALRGIKESVVAHNNFRETLAKHLPEPIRHEMRD